MMRGIFTTIQKNIEQESELSFYLCLYGGKWAPCSKPHPTGPWTFPGIMNPQFLWEFLCQGLPSLPAGNSFIPSPLRWSGSRAAPRSSSPTFPWFPGTPRLPSLHPFGTRRCRSRQGAAVPRETIPAVSPGTFGLGTEGSMRFLEKVAGIPCVLPANSMAATPGILFLALRGTGHWESRSSPMDTGADPLGIPTKLHQSQKKSLHQQNQDRMSRNSLLSPGIQGWCSLFQLGFAS